MFNLFKFKKLRRLFYGLFFLIALIIPKAQGFLDMEIKDLLKPSNLKTVTVVSVVDGDTLTALNENNKKIKIRLIGVDTPESVHPDKSRNTKQGQKASKYVKDLIKPKDKIQLEYDVQEIDKYNRHLCYVYFKHNGKDIMLNKHLLEKSYANLMTIPPNIKYVNEFKEIVDKNKK